MTGSEQLSRPFDVAEQDGLMELRTTPLRKLFLDLFLSWAALVHAISQVSCLVVTSTCIKVH